MKRSTSFESDCTWVRRAGAPAQTDRSRRSLLNSPAEPLFLQGGDRADLGSGLGLEIARPPLVWRQRDAEEPHVEENEENQQGRQPKGQRQTGLQAAKPAGGAGRWAWAGSLDMKLFLGGANALAFWQSALPGFLWYLFQPVGTAIYQGNYTCRIGPRTSFCRA